MIQLQPAETFPITRQIPNHVDTDTYFVQAVIKDAVNDATLATVTLDDKGGQYFRGNWKVIWDNSLSRGRYITIITSVYTDSGFTTKSENYGDDANTYLVQNRWDPSQFAGIGGGFNTKQLKKIFQEEIEKIPAQEKQDKLDIKALTEGIRDAVIHSLPPFPEIKEVDFTDIKNSLTSIDGAMNGEFIKIIKTIEEMRSGVPDNVIKQTKEIVKELKTELTNIANTASEKANLTNKEATDFAIKIMNKLEERIPTIVSEAMDNKNLSLTLNLQPNGTKEKRGLIESLKRKHKIK